MQLSRLIVLTVMPLVLLGGQAKVLKVGQEWEFTAREGDPHPTLVIDRIETLPKIGEIVHVSVRGVRIKNRRSPDGFTTDIAHMPFARLALERSLTRLVHDSVSLPAYEEGYEEWKTAQGGVYTITVREVLEVIEQSLR
jgi:hypothetical protein